ncbi:sensor histidine kinase [Streptomyces orinoci]|uniref:Histidine kinase n=1 Tax=Streptomyces orinoci TaxID=67339 RepID=A0ABV3K2T6_STRON|nr:histidine kinase [Streptomyces orinoci]
MFRRKTLIQEQFEQFEQFGLEKAPYIFYPAVVVAIGALSDILEGRDNPAWASVTGLLVFCACYLFSVWTAFSDRCGRVLVLLPALALTVLTVVLSLRFGEGMLWLFSLLAVVWSILAGRRLLLRPTLAVVLTTVLGGVTAAIAGNEMGESFGIIYATQLSGIAAATIVRLFSTVMELREAQEELAHSAVAEERLRFARDLHDLLGHSISLIVVKAEAVRRFADLDPETVRRHAGDIESVGRTSLEEIREAVSGYRERSLKAELKSAQLALRDAGTAAAIRQDGPPLPADADALLGWVVREGVTNVIRHSEARSCEIEVAHGSGAVELKISDDGGDAAAGAGKMRESGIPGQGLLGLAERLSAAGGALNAAHMPGGGYRLLATLPVVRRSAEKMGTQ